MPRLGKLSTSEVLKKGAILWDQAVTPKLPNVNREFSLQISTARTGNSAIIRWNWQCVESGHLDLKKSDVPGKNEELIGKYDQFIKSVVLAQDNCKICQVPKKERGALLEKIMEPKFTAELVKRLMKLNQVKKTPRKLI